MNQKITKLTWKTINELLNKTKRKSKLPISFSNNENKMHQKKLLTNLMIILLTQGQFDQNRKNHSKYLNDNFPKSMFLRNIKLDEITKMITDINSNKSCGIDEISPKVIQKLGPLISRPLCHIFNLTFPSKGGVLYCLRHF